MPVLQCAGCPRLISVSSVPGGNPVAKANPEQWSVVHTRCPGCGVSLCDRCAPASARRCKACGAALPSAGGGRLSTRVQARVAGLQAGRLWGLPAILVQAAFPLVVMMSVDRAPPRIVYWTGIALGAFAAWKLLAAMGKGVALRIVAVLAQFVPLVSLLVLVLLRGRALRVAADLASSPADDDETPAPRTAPVRAAASSAPARPAPPSDVDSVAQRIARVLGKPVRPYSTYEFGSGRDPRARSFLVGKDFPLNMVARMRTLLPSDLILFLGTCRWLGEEKHDGLVELVLAPGRDPLDAVRVGRVDPANHGLDAESVVARLRDYDRRFGLELYEANSDSVRFRLQRLPPEGTEVADDLLAFCPDLADHFATPADLMRAVRESGGWITLWWD